MLKSRSVLIRENLRLREALQRIRDLPSLPEEWRADQLVVSYPVDAQPWHIAKDALQ